MRCTNCGADSDGPSCLACGAAMPAGGLSGTSDVARTVLSGESNPTVQADPELTRLAEGAPSPAGAKGDPKGMMVPGQAFGPRYRVVRLLGAGGMGAVYQAWDAELGVTVALKTIRPGGDPWAVADLEQRFKRELLLAREVTHKNVVRIHDLGEIDGIKYITMSYVDGWSLSALLHERDRLPVPEALRIARQVASGLQAAHEAGVVHRDLKPANIMVDAAGHALILDFGIARLESSEHQDASAIPAGSGSAAHSGLITGATISGTVIGTLEYMAPEQANAAQVDHRADIYAFGLILRDMLAGLRPSSGRPLEDLRERVAKGLPSLNSVDASLPDTLDAIAKRCTEIDPAARYQKTSELCVALARLDDEGQPLPEPKRITWRVAAAAVIFVAGLTSGVAWLLRPAPPPPAHEPVSALITDFENLTGDPEFSGAIEQALGVGLERASFVSVFPRTEARALLAQIAPESGGRISTENGQLVAMREAIKVLVSGTINPIARGYRIGVRLLDPTDGKIVTSAERSVTGKSDVLKAVGELARDARAALGESKAEIEKAELEKAETYTASSLRAVQEYTIAQDFQADYKDQDAIEHYRRASTEDPNFGRAYAGWAYSALKLGRQDEAADAWKKALSLIERMTEREKYRTLGLYYGTMTRDFEKAIENYATLVRLYPADDAGHNNLALAYFSVRNFTKALEEGRLTVRLYPRTILYRNNVALYAMYASDFATAAAEATRVAQDKPDFYPAYLPLAIAALEEGKLDNARGFYAQMAKTGVAGASVAATGLADIALYVGQDAEAARILEEAIAEDVRTDNQTAMAAKYVVLAEAHLGTGRKAAAVRSARKALEISRSEEIAFPAARILSAAGLAQEADALARELGAQLEPQRRAYGKLIEADVARSKRQTVEALEAIRSAQKLTDLWLGRFMLGRLYVEAGRHAEAVSELDLAQKRRGEATAVFLDDIPSYRYLAVLPYWLGRALEGLGLTPAAKASYQAFIGVRSSAGKDPLIKDAKARMDKL